MNRTVFLLSLIIYSFYPFSANAQEQGVDYDWQLAKDEDNIQIYTSTVAGSKYRAVRTVTTINASLNSAVALVKDLNACSKWADLCVKSELVETVSNTEEYIYTYNNVPFPVKDRDVVSHVIWQHDAQTSKVSMHSEAVDGKYPEVKKAIRINQAIAQWHFSPAQDGQVLIESYAHINPNGPSPAWLINLLLVGSPFKTMTNMTAILESGEYQNEIVDFLK